MFIWLFYFVTNDILFKIKFSKYYLITGNYCKTLQIFSQLTNQPL